MKQALANLISAFNDENGLPELAYEATRELIELDLGTESAKMFCQYVDATDGQFYLRTGCLGEALYEIEWVAVSPD